MTVQGFDTPEAMFQAIRDGVEQAKAAATPRQNAITYGDHWMRVASIYGDRLLIAGRISTLEELAESAERFIQRDIADGVPEEETRAEAKAEADALLESYAEGFRFGYAYSAVEPDGELGDTHVCSMIPISAENFAAIKEAHYDLDAVRDSDWFQERLVDHVNDLAAHHKP